MIFVVCLPDEKPIFASTCPKATLEYTDSHPHYKIQQWGKDGALRGEIINRYYIKRQKHLDQPSNMKKVILK